MTKNCEKAEKQDVRLKKTLGVFNGVSMIVGVTVGSSIFITPGTVLQNSGSVGVCLLMWLAGGIFATIGALFSVELGVRYKSSGEKYLYLKRLCGYFPAYIYLWQYITLFRPASNSLKALVFSRYFLKPFFLHCKIPEVAIKLISTVVICFFGVLNSLSVSFFANVQMVMTTLTVMTIILISSFGLVPILQGHSENLFPFLGATLPSPSSLIQAFSSAVFGYFGWNALNFVVDEIKNPNKTLPLAIITSTTLITSLYVMVNISYIVILGFNEMVSSEAVAMSATAKILGAFSWIASLLISINAASSINTSIMIGSRLTLVGAANAELPCCLSLISVTRFTPIMSIIFQSGLTILFLWVSSVEQMINMLMFSTVVFEFLVVISYIKVKVVESLFSGEKIQNENEKLFKVPIVMHLSYGILLLFVISISLITNAQSFANGFFYSSLISLMYYVVFIFMERPSLVLNRYIICFNVFCQKLFMSATAVHMHRQPMNQV